MGVAIIGGGIAGLTMAIALRKANISFTVYEAANQIKPVGAGIAIANNAMQVFSYLGVSDLLAQKGVRISKVVLSNLKLKPFTISNLNYFENKYNLANIAIHRHALHEILLKQIPKENIVLGKRLQGIEQQKNGTYTINFTDNSKAQHTYVIGADGLRSKIRDYLFKDSTLRDAKQVCWRGTLAFDLQDKYDNTALEAWGRGKRFGFVKLDQKTVYWYFLVNESMYQKQPNLHAYLHDVDPVVQQFIKQTQDKDIFVDKIYDLKPLDFWHKDKVCLIGDAAHATTPNLGQGACQAIEDVYVISRLLEKMSLDKALEAYYKIRSPKANKVVKDSWQLGLAAQFENPLITSVRNIAFSVVPEYFKNKQMSTLFELQSVD